MAQAEKNKKASPKPAAKPSSQGAPNWPLFILALVGMALSAYLTFTAWQGKLVAFCTAGSACDVVLNSPWSTLFGMPTSFWGFLTYVLLAAVAWNKASDIQWKLAWVISFFGMAYSLYLTGVSVTVLNSACPYCLTSLGIMSLIFIVVTFQKPANLAGFSWGPWLGKSAGAALVAVLALHLHYAGYWGKAPRPEDPWARELAEHLASVGAKFYGAYWCPHCAEQKEMFGASARRLPYVECSPAGSSGPLAPECKEAGIHSYPTWIINGQRYTGTQSLEALAQATNFKPQGGKP